MNLQQLRYLVATVDTGTMTAAAAYLQVSQPSVTRALRSLEDELAITLLTRVGRRVELTEAGERVAELARRIIRDADSITAIRGPAVRLCATATQARELFSGAMARVAAAAPGVRVTLDTVDTAAQVVDSVLAGRAELGLCDRPERPGLPWTSLGGQELVLICPGHWSLPDPLPVARMDGMPMIMPPPGERQRIQLDSYFQQLGVVPDTTVTTDQRELVVPLVVDGVAAAFAWGATARHAAEQGAQVVHTVPAIRREVGVARRRGRLPAEVRAVLDALRDEAAVTWTA